MSRIVTITIMDRWPETLDRSLEMLGPFVYKKVAIVDQNPNLMALDDRQSKYFDIVKYSDGQSLDKLRNEALSLARNIGGVSWALVVDSDEYFEPASMIALCGAVASASHISAFLLPQINYVGHGRWATSYAFRAFRLDRPIKYSYEIHETIAPSLAQGNLRWQYLDAPIQHFDFVQPVRGKRARYRKLIQTAMDKGEDLAFLSSLYAAECFWNGEDEAAFRYIEEAIRLATDSIGHSRLDGRDDFPLTLKAQFLLHRGELDRAAMLFERLYDRRLARMAAESALGLSTIASLQGDRLAALEWIEASLARWESAEAIFSRAAILCDLDEPRSALRDIATGLRLNPMAGDFRILGEAYPETIFGWQCLMSPAYRGLPDLVSKLTEKISGPPA